MNVLVAIGSTQDMAARIAASLEQRRHTATVQDAEDPADLGSAPRAAARA